MSDRDKEGVWFLVSESSVHRGGESTTEQLTAWETRGKHGRQGAGLLFSFPFFIPSLASDYGMAWVCLPPSVNPLWKPLTDAKKGASPILLGVSKSNQTGNGEVSYGGCKLCGLAFAVLGTLGR